MSLDASEVMQAALSWVSVPPGCPEVRTDDFHLVAYPTTRARPTTVRIESDRPAGEVLDEVVDAAARLGRHDLLVWTHPGTRPAGLVETLLARGAVLDEELAVLARPLDSPPDHDVPADVEIRNATDLETVRVIDRLSIAVFGGSRRADEDLLAEYTDASTGLGLVAYRDGTALASASITLKDGVARLWGGCTLPEARHTGAYRALLAHRLELGQQAGCRLALVKARLETSAPILLRAGFEQYGEERSYLLTPGGGAA